MGLVSLKPFLNGKRQSQVAAEDGTAVPAPVVLREPPGGFDIADFSALVVTEFAAGVPDGEVFRDLRDRLEAMRGATADIEPDALSQAAAEFTSISEDLRARLKAQEQERAQDFRKVIGFLNDALSHLGTSGSRSDARFSKLGALLQTAAAQPDIHSLKKQLAGVQAWVEEEARTERFDREKALDTLQAQAAGIRQMATRFVAVPAGRQGAVSALRAELQKAGKGTKVCAAVFVADCARAIAKRHGDPAAQNMLRDVAKTRIATLVPQSQWFLWGPDSILLILSSRADPEVFRPLFQRSLVHPFSYQTAVGARVATFTGNFRWTLIPVAEPIDDVMLKADQFTAGESV